MSQSEKVLARMRNNPAGDWDIDDIKRICKQVKGFECRPPATGRHYTVSHPAISDILTIPANRPIKPVYVKRFVSMIDSIKTEGIESSDPSVAA